MTAVAALPTYRKCGRELKRNGEDWFCAGCWVTESCRGPGKERPNRAVA